MLSKPSRTPSSPLYYSNKIIEIFKLQTLLFAHRYYKNQLPPAFNNYFASVSDIHRVNTRHSRYGLAVPLPRSNYLIRSRTMIP